MKNLTLTITGNTAKYSIWKNKTLLLSGSISKDDESFLAKHDLRALLLTHEISSVLISSNPRSRFGKTLSQMCVSNINPTNCFQIHPHSWRPLNSRNKNSMSLGKWYFKNSDSTAIKPVTAKPFTPPLYFRVRAD